MIDKDKPKVERKHPFPPSVKDEDIYWWFLRAVKAKGALQHKVPIKTYRKVRKAFNKAVANQILTNALEYRLPARLGYLRIKKRYNPPRLDESGVGLDKERLITDWGASRKLWYEKYGTTDMEELKKIPNKPIKYHENKHTSRHIFRFWWDRRTSKVAHIKAYCFRASKENRVALGAILKDPNRTIDYYT